MTTRFNLLKVYGMWCLFYDHSLKLYWSAYIIDLRCNLIHDRISVMKALYKINYDINSLYGMYEATQRTFIFSFFAIYPSTPYKLRSLKYSLYYVTLLIFFCSFLFSYWCYVERWWESQYATVYTTSLENYLNATIWHLMIS